MDASEARQTMPELNIGGSNMTVELRENNTLYARAETGNKQWVAVLEDTHPKYNFDREFVAYQKPATSDRDSGTATVEDGAVIERVRFTHSGKNRKDRYYQLVDGDAHQIDEADVEAAIDGEIIPDVGPDAETIDELTSVEGVGEARAEALAAAGYESIADLEAAAVDELQAVDGIGAATAEQIVDDLAPDVEAGGAGAQAIADGGVEADDLQVGVRFEPEEEGVWEVVDERPADEGALPVRSICIRAIDAPNVEAGHEEWDAADWYAKDVRRLIDAEDSDDDRDPEPIADGGVEYEAYDIDPTELDYDESLTNHTSDPTNAPAYRLAQLDDADLWVAFSRSAANNPDGYVYTTYGIGRLSLSAPDLDTDALADQLREHAQQYSGDESSETVAAVMDAITSNAERVAADLADEWARGAEEIVSEAVNDGIAGIRGTRAWVGHVEDAFRVEAEWVLKDLLSEHGLEESEHRFGRTVLRNALSAVVCDRRSRLQRDMEYEARLKFEVEPWELRALELEQNSVLKNKLELAKVAALREVCDEQREIADRLDKHFTTVSRQLSQVDDWLDRSQWTVRNLDRSARTAENYR